MCVSLIRFFFGKYAVKPIPRHVFRHLKKNKPASRPEEQFEQNDPWGRGGPIGRRAYFSGVRAAADWLTYEKMDFDAASPQRSARPLIFKISAGAGFEIGAMGRISTYLYA